MRLFLYDLVTFCWLSGARTRCERALILRGRTARRPGGGKR